MLFIKLPVELIKYECRSGKFFFCGGGPLSVNRDDISMILKVNEIIGGPFAAISADLCPTVFICSGQVKSCLTGKILGNATVRVY